MTISVRHAENGLELWLHFSTDNLERERTLTPTEARALAAELVKAADEIQGAVCGMCSGQGYESVYRQAIDCTNCQGTGRIKP